MKNWDDEAKFWLLVAGVLTIILFSGVGYIGWAENFCLSRGYTSARITISGDAYCVKRVDQSDVVTPAKDLK